GDSRERKRMGKATVKAKAKNELKLRVIDANLIRSVWGQGAVRKDGLRTALEIASEYAAAVDPRIEEIKTFEQPEARTAAWTQEVVLRLSDAAVAELQEAIWNGVQKEIFQKQHVDQLARIFHAIGLSMPEEE